MKIKKKGGGRRREEKGEGGRKAVGERERVEQRWETAQDQKISATKFTEENIPHLRKELSIKVQDT